MALVAFLGLAVPLVAAGDVVLAWPGGGPFGSRFLCGFPKDEIKNIGFTKGCFLYSRQNDYRARCFELLFYKKN